MRISQIFGLLLILLVLAGVWAYREFGPTPSNPAPTLLTVKGYVGGEKMGLVQSPRLQELLQKKYQLILAPEKRGSVEMVTAELPPDLDFIWPGSQTQLELFKARQRPMARAEILFNSPIVIYSWDLVTEALRKEGIVEKAGDTYYIVDSAKLIAQVIQRKKWNEIGVPELFGNIKVICTDPIKSNSGAQFLALAATMLNGGETLERSHIAKVAPQLGNLLRSLGYLHGSSGDLFNQYLKQGMGAYPLVAGYENQIIEFALDNRAYLATIQAQLRILYPRPTVWSTHPMIALTPGGTRLITAMQDPAVQKLAWESHGFRAGASAISMDVSTLAIPGIPSNVTAVVPMPDFETFDALLKTISTQLPPNP
jgi:hypothetical protein